MRLERNLWLCKCKQCGCTFFLRLRWPCLALGGSVEGACFRHLQDDFTPRISVLRRHLLLLLLATECISMAHAHTSYAVGYPASSDLAYEFTVGVGQPVADVPLQVYVLVSNPAHALIPSGRVSVEFGDGSSETVVLTRGLAVLNHRYVSTGAITIKGSYSGDDVFRPGVATQSRVVLASAPPATPLNTFGSSTTAGAGASSIAMEYVSLVANAEGWSLHNYGVGGSVVSSETAEVYGQPVTSNSHSTLLIGRNEIAAVNASGAGNLEYTAALTANYGWLLVANDTPQKILAQNSSVSRTGAWSNSDIYSAIGLRSQLPGSTLTFVLPGSTLYIGLGTKAPDAVFSVAVDGQAQGTYQPTTLIGSPEVFGIRLPVAGSARTTAHSVTVTCVAPGANGCYVDWAASNGSTSSLARPYVWAMSPENETSGLPQAWYDAETADVQQLVSLFSSDGFSVAFSNVNSRLSGLASPECFASDHVHPLDCGHAAIAAALIASMNGLNAALQRITFDPTPALSTLETLNLQAAATSGLPVTFTVDAGSAKVDGSVLTRTAAGKVLVTAHQAGTASFLPAPSVSQKIIFTAAVPSLQLFVSSHTFGDAPFTIHATSKSRGPIAYTVVSGPATISADNVTLSGAGTVVLHASQIADAVYAEGVSDTSFIVARATPSLKFATSVGSADSGRDISLTVQVSGATSLPSGLVTFYDGATALTTVRLASGTAAIVISAPAERSHVLGAVYGGDSNYDTAAVSLEQAVQPTEIMLLATSDLNLALENGKTSSIAFSVAPVNADVCSSPVTFTVTGLPDGVSYSFDPMMLPRGSKRTQVTLSLGEAQGRSSSRTPGPSSVFPCDLLVLLPLGCGIHRKRMRLRRLHPMACVALAGFAVVSLNGCGSGYAAVSQKYTINVVATSGTRTVTLPVTLNLSR